jgi:hypothetical protein
LNRKDAKDAKENAEKSENREICSAKATNQALVKPFSLCVLRVLCGEMSFSV